MSRQTHGGTPPAGALTSIFTQPGPCATDTARYVQSSCMPPNWGAYSAGSVSYYSPGICPSAYTSAGLPAAGFGPNIETNETAIVCCPSSYRYGSTDCVAPRTTTISYPSIVSLLPFTPRPPPGYPITSESFDTANAIQVRWAASDIPRLETHPLTPGLKPTASSSTTGGGMNIAAKVGISVGAIFGALLLLSVGSVLLQKRRRDALHRAMHSPEKSTGADLSSQGVDNFLVSGRRKVGTASSVTTSPTKGSHPTDPLIAPASPMSQPTESGMAPETALQWVQQRRSRLEEIEHLAREEDRIRAQMGPGRVELPGGPELTSGRAELPGV